MRSELDRLMQDRQLAAIIVPVDEIYNPQLDYLVGRCRITHGLAIKAHNQDPVIVAHLMETEEAAATGYTVYSWADLGYYDILKAHQNNADRAMIDLWAASLRKVGVGTGKVGIYGSGRVHHVLAFVDALRTAYPDYTFIGEKGRSIFDEAAVTKDTDEIARIRDVAARTAEVQQATWDFISGHRADGETVVNADGDPLTIDQVRRFILMALLERGLEDIGMIFAQGRDAGYPHSRGNDAMPLKRGQSIVFDLFPREHGGGYFHDTTRTWCIDYAPLAVEAAYKQTMTAFDIALESFAVGKPTHLMQEAVLNYFESKGHPTIRSHPGTQAGYVHGLGHGLGLEIHERPSISHLKKDDIFQVGNIITIEPGLYYPEDGYGVRVEDTFIVMENGECVSLTPFRKDLILPLSG